MSSKQFGIPAGFIDELKSVPLWYSLQNEMTDHSLQPVVATPGQNLGKINDGLIDIAEVPAIELARSKQSWKIVPGAAVVSDGRCDCASLFFVYGLKEIASVAVPPDSHNEKALLQIILSEKFGMHPDITERQKIDPENEDCDAFLLIGDQARAYNKLHPNHFDLCEEWKDLTDLPFVHSLVAIRDLVVTGREAQQIKTSTELGRRKLEEIARYYEAEKGGDWKEYYDFLNVNFKYMFDERAQDGLAEFYNYAFLYGLVDFVPDMNFMDIS